MTVADVLRVPPEQMTLRARVFLLIDTAGCLLLAYFCAFHTAVFKSTSYNGVREALPLSGKHSLQTWGVVFLVAALLSLLAALRGHEQLARLALSLVVVSCLGWSGGFVASAFAHQLTGPTGPIMFGWVGLLNAVVLRNPLRDAFAPIKRWLEQTSPDDPREAVTFGG